jgi:hypothetical protein
MPSFLGCWAVLSLTGLCRPMLGLLCAVSRTVAGCSTGCCCLGRGVEELGATAVVGADVVVRRRVGRKGRPRVFVGRELDLGVAAVVTWGSSAGRPIKSLVNALPTDQATPDYKLLPLFKLSPLSPPLPTPTRPFFFLFFCFSYVSLPAG